MTAATRASWKTRPLPSRTELLDLTLTYTAAEAEVMKRGHIPEEMEDKWFIFFEDDHLHFHRSWTGYCIFTARLTTGPDGTRLSDIRVNRDEDEYTSTDPAADAKLLEGVIRNVLLWGHRGEQ